MPKLRVLVAGAGIFGVTAAVELARRGHRVTLVDPGPIPHPLAESTDISKLIRADYGSDDDYTRLGAESIRIWRHWNELFGETLFHETGLLFLTQAPLEERPFERESFERAGEIGYRPERISPQVLRERFPAWNADRYIDGYFNPVGGWAMSGKVVTRLVERAKSLGGELHPDSPERLVTDEETARLRAFLAGSLPALADAPIVNTRVCLYCDTWDGHFWIAHDPERPGLALATGGSGHGLKFAPVLGPLIADVVERKPNPYAAKFRWRPEVRGKNEEEARHKARI